MAVDPRLKVGERIYESAGTHVYRARLGDEPVVLKTPRSGTPEPTVLAGLRREHELLKGLRAPCIVQTRGLVELDGKPALVLEDFGGESLRRVLETRTLGLTALLEIALQLTGALDALREHGLVHKDINPANIIVRLEPLTVKLTDFGLAQRLSYDGRESMRPERTGGTPAYISPEQTGRISHAVDYRTDYYSLGVTLYRMFTGRLPFDSADPLELVAAHIARTPESPAQVAPHLPRPLCAIILKLMEKAPENRYLSPAGLRADLTHCLEHHPPEGPPPAPFEPGRQDHPIYFQIPQKLYGREAPLEALLEARAETATQGVPRLVLVSGEAGVGKSSLIREAQRPTAERRGFFASGKFDPFKQHVPFSALVPAFNELLTRLLAESDAMVERWSFRLSEAVGGNGQVLAGLLPALEPLIGPQPPVPELGAVEAQNRLHLVCVRFLHALASRQSPLVLFLDDLQWADSASLGLLHSVVADGETRHLLVVGTYRDNEVDDGHRLMAFVRGLRDKGVPVERLPLAPIGPREVEALVGDALARPPEAARELAEVVFHKTLGNPFFVSAFLRSLHKEGAITYEPGTGWHWDMARVRTARATANVLEVMEVELARLPPATHSLLQHAACLGGTFELSMLALAAGIPSSEVQALLEPALAQGFLFIQGSMGLFTHDRVREATYASLATWQAQRRHHAIGIALLAHCDQAGDAELQERLFDVVGQLMKGFVWLSLAEKLRLARLCLEAGRRAKGSTAYEAAFQYTSCGIDCLPPEAWRTHSALARDLHLQRLECAHLTRRHDDFEALFQFLAGRLERRADKAALYQFKVAACINQGRLPEALDEGAAGLRTLFGLELPRTDEAIGQGLQAEIGQALARLEARPIPALVDLPELTSPDRLARLRLAAEMLPAAFMSQPRLFVWMVAHLTHQFLEHGRSHGTPEVFLAFSQVLGPVMKNYEAAYQLGCTALELHKRAPHPATNAKVHFLFAWFCGHWKRHAREDLEHALTAHRRGAENGDLTFSSYGLIAYFHALLTLGTPLAELRTELDAYAGVLRRMNDRIAIAYNLHIFPNVVRNLLGESADPLVFELAEHEDFREQCIVDALLARGHLNPLLFYWLYKMQLAYLFRRPARALELAARMVPIQDAMMGELAQAEFVFYHALSIAAVWPGAPEAERPGLLSTLTAHQELLALWAGGCPENFGHKHLLVEAEHHRLHGRVAEAMAGYRAASASARQHHYTQNEALAYELAGRLQAGLGDDISARGYLREARRAHARWGAVAKIRALEAEFPAHLPPGSTGEAPDGPGTPTDTHGFESLDVGSLVKSLRAVSSEIRLERLIRRLLEIVAESAGARRAFLLRDGPEGWVVEAGLDAERGAIQESRPPSLAESPDVREAVVKYVARTRKALVLEDAASAGPFMDNAFIRDHAIRSVMCAPLLNQSRLVAILYLDNNLTVGAFTAERQQVLHLLLAQAALAIENASLYTHLEQTSEDLKVLNEKLEEHSRTLEQNVAARTAELREKNDALSAALDQLRLTQNQLVMQEKLASLGALTAGIAHELKNPLNFVNNFAQLSVGLLQELETELRAREDRLGPDGAASVSATAEDLRRNLERIESHGRRASDIISSMLLHSQGTVGQRERVDLNALLTESVGLAYHGMRGAGFELEVREEYEPGLEPVELVAAEMRRVFVNIVNNACYAARQKKQQLGGAHSPVLTVRTRDGGDRVEVRIRDNGTGIPAEVRDRIFNPFFTTKPTGEATGLGLSISYDIVVQGHQGEMRVETEPGEFTELIITLPKRLRMPLASGGRA